MMDHLTLKDFSWLVTSMSTYCGSGGLTETNQSQKYCIREMYVS